MREQEMKAGERGGLVGRCLQTLPGRGRCGGGSFRPALTPEPPACAGEGQDEGYAQERLQCSTPRQPVVPLRARPARTACSPSQTSSSILKGHPRILERRVVARHEAHETV